MRQVMMNDARAVRSDIPVNGGTGMLHIIDKVLMPLEGHRHEAITGG
jgi:uncharacterized surface protein with fasciclin (FAS1) repeats